MNLWTKYDIRALLQSREEKRGLLIDSDAETEARPVLSPSLLQSELPIMETYKMKH